MKRFFATTLARRPNCAGWTSGESFVTSRARAGRTPRPWLGRSVSNVSAPDPALRPADLPSAPPLPGLPGQPGTDADEPVTHFGFQEVLEADKEGRVGEVFASVADSYDVMNDAMSFGIHRLWKDSFVRGLGLSETSQVLDVAGGTGDIAFRCLDQIRALGQASGKPTTAHVTVLDINPSMLAVGQQRATKLGINAASKISWVEGNAEDLSAIPSDSMDLYTIAFGIRNCTHIDRVLSEAYRVLKRGGRFACLEFGRVDNPLLAQAYDAYSFMVIPPVGGLIANDRASYQYLVESIRKFPPQPEFARMIRDAGFQLRGDGWENMSFGVAALHSGMKT